MVRPSSLLSALLLSVLPAVSAVDVCSTPFNTAQCFAHQVLLCCASIGAGVCCNFSGLGVTEVLVASIPVGFRSRIYSGVCGSSSVLATCDGTFSGGTDCCLWSGSSLINGAKWFAITGRSASDSSVDTTTSAVGVPNMVSYYNKDGVQRNVTIPAGQGQLAANAIAAGNFVSLFDTWADVTA
jgi:hypothetical protein